MNITLDEIIWTIVKNVLGFSIFFVSLISQQVSYSNSRRILSSIFYQSPWRGFRQSSMHKVVLKIFCMSGADPYTSIKTCLHACGRHQMYRKVNVTFQQNMVERGLKFWAPEQAASKPPRLFPSHCRSRLLCYLRHSMPSKAYTRLHNSCTRICVGWAHHSLIKKSPHRVGYSDG